VVLAFVRVWRKLVKEWLKPKLSDGQGFASGSISVTSEILALENARSTSASEPHTLRSDQTRVSQWLPSARVQRPSALMCRKRGPRQVCLLLQ